VALRGEKESKTKQIPRRCAPLDDKQERVRAGRGLGFFQLRFLSEVGVVAFCLGGAGEHFDEVVVEAVVELALEAPLELFVLKVSRMYVEVVDVDRCCGVFETDADLDGIALGTSVEGEERVFVEAELPQH
jgi:hypothetical protein